jgi:hypothetical protein
MAHNNPATRREYDKLYRARHRPLYNGILRARRNRLKEHVRRQKMKPCADCGNSYPYYVMDFDHRPGEEKKFEIADFLATKVVSNYAAVDAEIAKCDVVCANCHRVRTHLRRAFSGPVAQRIEHEPSKLGVVGSSPTGIAN